MNEWLILFKFDYTVLIDKPWFFGHGGVDDKSATTGLTCWR